MIFLNDDFSCSDMLKAMNEVYIGKTTQLLNMEKQLDIFRNKYVGNYIYKGVNSDPDLVRFNRMMERNFGFGTFSLHVEPSLSCNAYTIPIDFIAENKESRNGKALLVDKKGYKFNKEYDYTCMVVIYSGLIFNPGFTTGEIMSVILHEIGHNFAGSIDRKHGALIDTYIGANTATKMLSIIDKYCRDRSNDDNISTLYNELDSEIFNDAQSNEILSNVFLILAKMLIYGFTTIDDIIILLPKPRIIILIATVVSQLIFNRKYNKLKYTDERIADNFVTIYGYGAEFISFEDKLSSPVSNNPEPLYNIANKIPIVSTLLNTYNLPFSIIIGVLDEHPDSICRCKDQLDLLEYEVKKNDLDPKMRKTITADIEECKKSLNGLTDVSKGLLDPYLTHHLYYNYLASKDKSFKNLKYDQNDRFKSYDRVYNKKIKGA